MTRDSFDQFISLCLQADCGTALSRVSSVRLAQLSEPKRQIIKRFKARFSSSFVERSKSADPLRRLIRIYEKYWHQALLKPEFHARYEKQLVADLRTWFEEQRGVKLKTRSKEQITNLLKTEIERMGYFCITGTVAPLQDLEIWRTQTIAHHSVFLPETRVRVKTFLLSGFLTKGWMAYATMGLYYPGGWACKDALYCNTHAYDLKSEKFRVSYIAHEAQHFSDYKRFPRLNQIDLEYRAKLAEFALADRTLKRMYQVFASRAEYNERSPHAFANFCVARDLAREITGVASIKALSARPDLLKKREVNAAAAALIVKHSVALCAKGRRQVRRHVR